MREHRMCKFTEYCKYDHNKCINIHDSAKKLANIQKQLEEIQRKSHIEIKKERSV